DGRARRHGGWGLSVPSRPAAFRVDHRLRSAPTSPSRWGLLSLCCLESVGAPTLQVQISTSRRRSLSRARCRSPRVRQPLDRRHGRLVAEAGENRPALRGRLRLEVQSLLEAAAYRRVWRRARAPRSPADRDQSKDYSSCLSRCLRGPLDLVWPVVLSTTM